MDIKKEIKKQLTDSWKNGETQEDIAKRLGISRTYLNRILSGKRSVDGITLKTLLRMFPAATISLDGSVVADNSGTVNGVVGINNGTVTTDGEAFRSKAIDALLESELPPECAIKAIKIIKNL